MNRFVRNSAIAIGWIGLGIATSASATERYVPVNQTAQSSLKLHILAGLPTVDGVFINGHGPYRFLLDTGAESNEMDPALARKLGLKGAFELELDSPSGASTVQGTIVNTLSLGPLVAADQEFLLVAPAALRAVDPAIRGSLGQLFLSRFNYLLDFRRQQIRFGGPAPAGRRVSFRLSCMCMMIPTSEGDLLLASGTTTLFLFRDAPRSSARKGMVSTTAQNMVVRAGWTAAIEIGGRLYLPGEAFYGQPRNSPAEGLLPANLFGAIYVSNSERYVVFEPDSPD